MRYIVKRKGRIYRHIAPGECAISQGFFHLKGDYEQCLVNGTNTQKMKLRRQTGKAGLLPGCTRGQGRAAPLAGRRFGGPRVWQGPWGPRHGFGGGHGPHGPFGPGFGPGRHWDIPAELLALRTEAAEVARLFAIASRGAFEDKERLSQLRAFVDRSHKELSDMIYGSAQGQASGEKESASGTSNVGQA